MPGINCGRPLPSQESVDDIRAIFDVNVFGAVRVTQAFLPCCASPQQGIVMISSSLDSISATLDMTSENWRIGSAGRRKPARVR